jgi:hypothetical protein
MRTTEAYIDINGKCASDTAHWQRAGLLSFLHRLRLSLRLATWRSSLHLGRVVQAILHLQRAIKNQASGQKGTSTARTAHRSVGRFKSKRTGARRSSTRFTRSLTVRRARAPSTHQKGMDARQHSGEALDEGPHLSRHLCRVAQRGHKLFPRGHELEGQLRTHRASHRTSHRTHGDRGVMGGGGGAGRICWPDALCELPAAGSHTAECASPNPTQNALDTKKPW